jgi:hypothetical protein
MAPAGAWKFSSASGYDAGLRGRLEQFGLATVLTFLELERRSGQVRVIAGNELGRVSVRGGRVISARIESSGEVNTAAIFELLSWNRGSFSFTQVDLSAAPDEIGMPTMFLLMEAARRTDEAATASV